MSRKFYSPHLFMTGSPLGATDLTSHPELSKVMDTFHLAGHTLRAVRNNQDDTPDLSNPSDHWPMPTTPHAHARG
jgi:hypothetical protein